MMTSGLSDRPAYNFRILQADTIVPGHGAPFSVTPDLIRRLLASFGDAPFHERCPDVRELLRKRLRGPWR